MFFPKFKCYFCCIWQQQLFKVFCKEFLFFCYFEKMNDSKHAFGTSSWIKNSGSIANIWRFEITTIGNIQRFSILHHVLFLSYTYFLVCPHLILFSHICIYVFILESHYFRKFIAASQLKKSNVSLKARHT